MSRAKRLEKLEQTLPAREPVTAHTLSTRALEASWKVLERRSFDASAEVIDAVTTKLLARHDCAPVIRRRVTARMSSEA